MTGGSLYPSGRLRILTEHVHIGRVSGSGKRFTVRIDTENYASVPDDNICTLVVSESSFQRHVVNIGTWKEISTDVSFTVPNHLAGRFSARLMVASGDADSLGMLTATCESVQVDTGDGPNVISPLLSSRYDPDLTSYGWRFEIVGGLPQVAFNIRLQPYPEFKDSGYFRGLVLPEIVRKVLEWLFLSADPTEEDSIARKWMMLLCDSNDSRVEAFLSVRQDLLALPGRGLDDAAERHIETMVHAFCAPRDPIGELVTQLERA